MIYLNQAGTSWPKPPSVHAAAAAALAAPPDTWNAAFHAAHEAFATSLGVTDRRRLLLTPGCTSALAVAIADHPWASGDRIVTSHLEHHALVRPATLLAGQGVEHVEVPRAPDGPLDLDALDRVLAEGRTRLVAMTGACNVTGELLPIEDVIERAHAAGALVLIDAAQLGGWFDLDLPALGADVVTFAAHKGLHAPWGLGALYVAPHVTTTTPAAACEVGGDEAPCAPMPGFCDVGSVDLGALAGLHAALDWLAAPEQEGRLAVARERMELLVTTLEACPTVRLLGVREPARRLPTIAFTVEGRTSSDVAAALRTEGLVVGSGLQCAPRAHEALGTAPEGAARLSVGPMFRADDAAEAAAVLKRVLA